MKTVAIAVLAAVFLTGCDAWYSEMCIRGVLYYQFTSGAAIGVDQDGKPIKCK